MFERTPEERAEDEARATAIAADRAATPGSDGEWKPSGTPTAPAGSANPGIGSYAVAILLPVVGVILAIRQFARNNSGPAVALLLTSVVAGGIFYAVVSSTGSNGQCIVTALGGEKLCGDDAKAWCDATDSLRAESADAESQRICDELRG